MDLRKSKFILPNLFTLSSVLFGLLSVIWSMEGTSEAFRRAALAIVMAAIADGLDGRVARMTRTETKFGVQLDSLADVLSFGMAPAVLAYAFALRQVDAGSGYIGVGLSFLYVACGAMRLARFNVQSERSRTPSNFFTGLPIPGAAGIVATLVWTCVDLEMDEATRTLLMGGAMLSVAMLMVSSVRYRNFKHVHMSSIGKAMILVLMLLVLVAVLKTRASVVLLGLGTTYVLLGPSEWLLKLAWKIRFRHRRRSASGPQDHL
jgi:CDP-diacylglycerol--serine O-phosphatidyltransferase